MAEPPIPTKKPPMMEIIELMARYNPAALDELRSYIFNHTVTSDGTHEGFEVAGVYDPGEQQVYVSDRSPNRAMTAVHESLHSKFNPYATTGAEDHYWMAKVLPNILPLENVFYYLQGEDSNRPEALMEALEYVQEAYDRMQAENVRVRPRPSDPTRPVGVTELNSIWRDYNTGARGVRQREDYPEKSFWEKLVDIF